MTRLNRKAWAQFVSIALPYWTSKQKWKPIGLSICLIVLLIVLNLGVAAWWTLRPSPRVPVDHALDGVPKLQLAGERKSPLPAAAHSSAVTLVKRCTPALAAQ